MNLKGSKWSILLIFSIIKQPSGGIKVNSTTQLDISYDTIKSLALDFRIPNAEITIKENINCLFK
mgnify:CR=1 FL=1